MKKFLITGAGGRLGGQMITRLRADGHTVIAAHHTQTPERTDNAGFEMDAADLTDFTATRDLVARHTPDLVIHTAAWTDVDGCARDPERALVQNGLATQNVAIAAANVGAALLYVSSNEVFNGKTDSPYREYDHTVPANPYGYSKWVGERAVLTLHPRHYIVRTSWMFAHGGSNFVHAMLKGARSEAPLRVVANEIGCPTYADDLADAITALIGSGRYGIYHFVNEGAVSRYDFARRILNRAGFTSTPIQPIVSSAWPRPSTPPAFSPLANHAGRSIGIVLRPWQQALDDFLRREGLFAPSGL